MKKARVSKKQLMPCERIAVIGGSFDPIHNAHLALASALVEIYFFDKIIFLPCAANPLKPNSKADAQDRASMVQSAIKAHENYILDTQELERKADATSTLVTLKALRGKYPEASIAFIMGGDSWNTLHQWPGFETFLNYVHLIVFARFGTNFNTIDALNEILLSHETQNIQDILENLNGFVFLSQKVNENLSSTEIRKKLEQRSIVKNAAALQIPLSVWEYIIQHDLYTSS